MTKPIYSTDAPDQRMNNCLRTPQSVRRIEVIEVVDVRGMGTEQSTIRKVTQYWSMEGLLLAERDPCAPQPIDTMNRFAH